MLSGRQPRQRNPPLIKKLNKTQQHAPHLPRSKMPVPPELELVEADDQITHEVTLDDKLEPQVREGGKLPGSWYSCTCASCESCGIRPLSEGA
jgi:hypothetical protein